MRTLLLLACFLAAPALAQTDAVPVTVAPVTRQDVPVFVRGIGNVQAFRSVLVRARVDGTLDQIAFTEGQEVKPGDLLAVIDPRPYAAVLAGAEAKRDADAATLANAKRDLARYASLARTDFASRQQVDTQQALVNETQATLEGDGAAIDAAQLNLSFCRIEAPIEGVVGLRLVDTGNLIHATDTQGIIRITQVHPIALVFTLPQDTLPRVRTAMAQGEKPRVLAYTSDNATALSEGTLLTPDNSIDATTGTIALKAVFENRDNRLWPGQFVAARLQLGIERGVQTIPLPAIEHGPDGLYVYVVRPDHTVAPTPVATGYEDERLAVITSGLADGDQVVVAGQSRLQAGVTVEPHPAAKS